MIKTAVVILNWNTRKYLETFLPFLVKFSTGPEVEIIIADNASTDGSVEFVREAYPDMTIIVHNKNYGFAEGYNKALRKVTAEYYVILNSDIEVTEHWLAPMTGLLDRNPQIAACMPKIRSYHERGYFEYAGAAGGYIDKLGYPFCKGRIFDTVEKDEGQYDGAYPVFWATGACLAIRSELFHRFGGFDPYFFAHQEEVDLCWRLWNAGYEIYCTADSMVYHIGGGTLPKSNPKKTYLNFRNNLVLIYKNTTHRKSVQIIMARLVLDGIAAIKMFLEWKPKEFAAIFKAHLSFYRYLFTVEKPKGLKRLPSLPIFPKSIVFQYFIKKNKKYSALPVQKMADPE